MKNKHGIEITERDRMLRAWYDSLALIWYYEEYAKETDGEVSKMFSEFAEDEGFHASKLLEKIKEYEQNLN